MKRILVAVSALVALVAVVLVSVCVASPYSRVVGVKRAKVVAGVYTPDSSAFILEGNSGSTPTCNDTTESFFVGDILGQSNFASGTNAVPLIRVAIAGVPTGVAVDTLRAFIDYANDKAGPWFTAGAAVPTGWDITLLKNSPTAASDTTGAGASYALGGVASGAVQSVYSGTLALTSVTAGTAVTSPIGWQWARLRLTGDKTTGTLSSLLWSRVWVAIPTDVAPGSALTP